MPIDNEGNITPGDTGLVMTPTGPRAADSWEMPRRRVKMSKHDSQHIFPPRISMICPECGLICLRREASDTTVCKCSLHAKDRNRLIAMLEELQAVEDLEYHNKNWLSLNDCRRSIAKRDLLTDALKILR